MFSEPKYSFDVYESAKKGAIVGRVEAHDADGFLAYHQVTYSLASEWGADTFSLDPISGVMTVSALGLDHEDIEHFVLIVSAKDGGDPPQTATATVYVNVSEQHWYAILVLERRKVQILL